MRLADLARGVVTLAMAACVSALQAQTQKQLVTIEQRLITGQDRASAREKRSQSLVAELTELRRQSIDIARRTQESEALMSQLERQLVELRDEAIHRESLLKLRRTQLSG